MTTPDPTQDTQPTSAVGRRSLLAAAGGLAFAGLAHESVTVESASAATHRRQSRRSATFEWLGNAGWRISTPATTLLVDPYLSRFDTGLAAGRFDQDTRLHLDTAAIDAALGPVGTRGGSVDAVLVTHTHWDHFADVPHIATTRGPEGRSAMVYTTLSGYHLGQAMGLSPASIAVVKGGEELHVGDVIVRVVSSLHSRTTSGGLLFPGVRTQVPPAPVTIADLPEGDTVSFVIRRPDGSGGVLLLGASDYDDQALRGLHVDTVALPVPSNDVTVDYVGRMLRALDRPQTVILVHWDNFERPLRNPPTTDDRTRRRMEAVTSEIRRVSPRTRVIEPTYQAPMTLL